MNSTRGKKGPVQIAIRWIMRQPPKVKSAMAVVAGMLVLVLLWFVVHDHESLFVFSEACHVVGIVVLIYKLTKYRSCAGISLKTQELTAIFLAIRLYCSLVLEQNIHTVLDSLTLGVTLWVVYMMRVKLRSSYAADKDNIEHYYVIVPCAVVALVIHPTTSHIIIHRMLWAFVVYLEAVSVYPQLKAMQNTKIVEPFTAHYVFALGLARFLSCAHWVLQVISTRGAFLTALGKGIWLPTYLLSEIVQTFILADFCYYYVKSVVGGDLVLRLPTF